MATSIDDLPTVFLAEPDWTFPGLRGRALPAGSRLDIDTDDSTWAVFDTVDRDLEAAGASLARRGNDQWRLHLDGRVETVTVPGRTVPAALRDVLLGVRAGAALRRVADVTGELVTRVVVDGHDRVLGEIDDLRVTDGLGNVTRRIELTTVEAEFGAAVEKRLMRSGARPAVAAAALPKTVADAIRQFVHTQRMQVLRGDVRLRRAPLATDAVHPTRVAIRRLRSALRVVAVFDDDRAAALDAELSWLSGVLGAVRDADVLHGHLAAALDRVPESVDATTGAALAAAHEVAMRALDEQLAAAQQQLASAMSGRRYLAVLRELRTWDSAAPFTAAADAPVSELAAYARQATKIMRRRLRNADDVEATHRARKAAKRARYVNELVADALPAGSSAKALRKAGKDAKQLQTDLGERQDSVVAAAFLEKVAQRADITRPAAFGCGVLWAAERRAATG